MNIVMANDHGAVELKNRLRDYLVKSGHRVTNLGIDSEERVDYPDMAAAAIAAYRKGGFDFGILLCGTGIGISMAANRHKGIRCALVHDIFTAIMAREHNDANFLAFGGRVDYQTSPEAMLDAFIKTSFQGGRHSQRIEKLDTIC